MQNYKIAAVVVAYNNSSELLRCINGIFTQSYKIQLLIVIDNSNETESIENKTILKNYKQQGTVVKYICTGTNLGSAEGYAIGMRESLKSMVDFVWLNDQDGCPEKDCLKKLIEGYNLSQEPGIYAPQVFEINKGYVLKYFRSNLNIFNNQIPAKISNDISVFEICIAGTTGILIHCQVLETIGVYNGEVFFVGNEDVEYCMRALFNGFPIRLVVDSKYFHPDLLVKYSVKKKLISNLLFPAKLKPLNLGVITDVKDKRQIKNCIGASYVNSKYNSFARRYFNLFYSVFGGIFNKIINNNVNLYCTFKAYVEGIKYANNVSEKDKIF
jgi:GT2 family glycosyltransferase